MKCWNPYCQNEAEYGIYKHTRNTRLWVKVCGKCEQNIARENLKRSRLNGKE